MPDPTTETASVSPAPASGGFSVKGEIKGSDIFTRNIEPPQAPEAQTSAQQVETTAQPVSEAPGTAVVQETKPAPTAEAAPAKQPETPTAQDWKTEVLKQPVTEVLKAIGLDEKWTNLFDLAASGGDVTGHVQKMTEDYTKISDADVMRRQLLKSLETQGIKDLSDEEIEDLYLDEVVAKYKLDPSSYSEREMKSGAIALKIAAANARKEMTAERDKLALTPVEGKVPPELAQYQEQTKKTQEAIASYSNSLAADPYVKAVIDNKQVTIGEGPEAFLHQVADPKTLTSILTDQNALAAALVRPDGSQDFEKQILMSLLLQDPKAFVSNLISHGKHLGTRETVTTLENPSNEPNAPAKASPVLSAASAYAKGQYREVTGLNR